jgi:hypothetical protein
MTAMVSGVRTPVFPKAVPPSERDAHFAETSARVRTGDPGALNKPQCSRVQTEKSWEV